MPNSLADKSFLVFKPQVSAATPILPSIFAPLVSVNIPVDPGFQPGRTMKGINWESDDIFKGKRTIKGDIEILADPDNEAHFVNMVCVKTSTSGDAANGYTHIFDPGEGKSYSLDIPRGIYAQRLYGWRGTKISYSFEDNKKKIKVTGEALGQFYGVSLAIALTGVGMTTAVFKTDYDLRPTDGLVIGDVINVGGVDLTLTSVNANGVSVGFASTAVTAAVGDLVSLKAKTPSLTGLQEPFYFGNMLVGIGADSAAADTAAATRATATICEEITADYDTGLQAHPGSGYTGPAVLLNGIRSGSVGLTRLFTDPTQYQKWIEGVKQAVTIICTGRYIDTGLSISEKSTIKINKVKLMTNDEPLEVGQYIMDKQSFKILYDQTDGAAIRITIVNRTAGTVY